MAAPDYVPRDPLGAPRAYRSNPRRPESWIADRPGEVVDGGQPRGDGLGSPGPDLGYALLLARTIDDRLVLAPGESREDAVAGLVAIAMRRSSLFGRAPVIHDLTVAATIWGLLDEDPDPELLARRRQHFAGVANQHHYPELRDLVDSVPEATLRRTPDQVRSDHAGGWRPALGLG